MLVNTTRVGYEKRKTYVPQRPHVTHEYLGSTVDRFVEVVVDVVDGEEDCKQRVRRCPPDAVLSPVCVDPVLGGLGHEVIGGVIVVDIRVDEGATHTEVVDVDEAPVVGGGEVLGPTWAARAGVAVAGRIAERATDGRIGLDTR